MTITIGFPHFPKDGEPALLFASDSQLTLSGTAKRCDSRKIFGVPFKDGTNAIIGISGHEVPTLRFLDEFTALAANAFIDSEYGPANLAGDCMKKVRRLLEKDNALDPMQIRQDFPAEIVLGYIFNQRATVFKLGINDTTAIRASRKFEAVGCAQDLAGFMLTEVDFNQLNLDAAAGLAFIVIELCKFHDSQCGGPVQWGAIADDGKQFIYNPRGILCPEKGEAGRKLLERDHKYYMRRLFESLPHLKK